ncbi:hydroxyacid dehydrogenase, partial [Lactobacillus sp. XV13L]|nr:hydroxyacid dehydrogenase [Lactobacillus sp. XV13L]
TSATKDYFNAGFFKHLTKQPLFISIGRGPSTNTADLITALKKQQLSAAALDVTDPEPLPADNPLWQMGNVLISPHISGIYSEYTMEAIELFHTNLQYFHQDGTVAINQVDFNKGY